MLELPITIRIPKPEELGYNRETIDELKKLKNAKIIEGYTLKYPPEITNFKFFAEININNSNLWNLLFVLIDLLPERISLIYGIYGKEARISHELYLLIQTKKC